MIPENNAGVPWALKRLQNACKLDLTVSEWVDDKPDLPLDAVTAVMQASQSLSNLEILVRCFILGSCMSAYTEKQ